MPSAHHRDREKALATGQRLTELMDERGLTAEQLSSKVGIQSSTLENFCAGHPSIPSDVLRDMATELGTSVEYLLTSSDDPRPTAARGTA
jgi:transcriptional regulator with XRE-family HTH domain